MVPGDWTCPNCGDHVFARNSACRRCGTPKPVPNAVVGGAYARVFGGGCAGGGYGQGFLAEPQQLLPGGGGDADMRPGDWFCPSCGDLQFARNSSCRRCGAMRPAGGGAPMPRSEQADFSSYQTAMQAYYGAPAASTQALGPATNINQEVRQGDWICPACGDHQFARNDSCRRCSKPKPSGGIYEDELPTDLRYTPRRSSVDDAPAAFAHRAVANGGGGAGGSPQATPRAGDWHCESCGDLQFARNPSCRRCGALRPPGIDGHRGDRAGGCRAAPSEPQIIDVRAGDWTCPNCGDHVFARNNACRRCDTPRPSAGGGGAFAAYLRSQASNAATAFVPSAAPAARTPSGNNQKAMPGDWYCPQCSDLQFARNSVCRMCSTPKPEDEANGRMRSRSPRR